MATNLVDELCVYLAANKHAGGQTQWALLRRRDMDGPGVGDRLVVVSEDGGPPPERGASAGALGDAALADVGVMVMVRAEVADSDASFAKAREMLTALHGLRSVVLGGHGGTLYYRVTAMTGEPMWAGFDDRGRPRHTVAFRCLRDV